MFQTHGCTFCTCRTIYLHLSIRHNLRVTAVYFPHFSAIRQSVVVAWEPSHPLSAHMTGFPDHPSLFTHAFQEMHYIINSSLVMDENKKSRGRRNGSGNCPRRLLSLVGCLKSLLPLHQPLSLITDSWKGLARPILLTRSALTLFYATSRWVACSYH